MQRGFIQIPILIAIIVTAVLGGGAYVAYEVAKPSQSDLPKEIAVETETQATTTADTSTTAQVEKKSDAADEKDSVIDSLKKQVADLTQKVSAPKIEPQNTIVTPKTTTVTLPSGAIVEMDANGNIVHTIKEAPQQTYTAPAPTTQNQPQTIVQPVSENTNSTPAQPVVIDASVPKIWEAQFGEQIRTHIPELSTWAPKMIRLVTNEPIDVGKTKFRFRSPLGTNNLQVTFNIISNNVARGPADTCYVNCDLGGYYSTFFLDEPLTAKIPQGTSVPGSYDFEFLVVDMAGNYSVQWHSARDVSEFIFE